MDEVRNVALITIDCLRADHLHSYGYNRNASPFLTTLANRSTQFENAFATGPGTSVSFPSILTGSYPLEFGGYATLSSDRKSVASVAAEADIKTIGIHSNTYLSRTFGYQRGFDTYESFYDRSEGIVQIEDAVSDRLADNGLAINLLKRLYKPLFGSSGKSRGVSLPYEPADTVTDTIVKNIDNVSSPFFLWAHYMDVHAPHHPPDRHFGVFSQDLPDWDRHHEEWMSAKEDPTGVTKEIAQRFVDAYDAELRFVDEQLNRLFDRMKQIGLYEDTVYIITADHGELLGEHDSFSHPPRLYDELLHVPLLIHFPGQKEGQSIEQSASLIDLPTTITDALSIRAPTEYRGQSLMSGINEGRTPRDRVFAQVCHRPDEGMSGGVYDPSKTIISCRNVSGKIIVDNQRDTVTFRPVNRKSANSQSAGELSSEMKRSLRTAVKDHLASLEITDDNPGRVDINQETASRLQDLGYIE